MSLLSRLAKIAAEKSAEKLAVRKGAKTAERAAEDLAVRPRAPTLAVKPKALPAPPKPKALPAPKKVLALPKPGPGLPEYAAKPKGGQWWPDKTVEFPGWTGNYSPEQAVRESGSRFFNDYGDAEAAALRDWWQKALPRYIKNDMATPDDPLRDLAARGLIHGDFGPESWSAAAKNFVTADPASDIMFPKNPLGGMPGAGSDFRGGVLAAMPWVGKMPATDNLYGVGSRAVRQLDEDLGFRHVADEMRNALAPDATGIPADLAVRPESLARMSFPQAVERVGRINQWRAKQMEQAALSNLNSPAIHTFKEYAENNPMGLRWVELRKPDVPADYALPVPRKYRTMSGDDRFELETPDGEVITAKSAEDALRNYYPPELRQHLQEALKYEGDTMGHCVGGYCDDVLSGRSRIFSLRDAKGEPHVTIETAPGSRVWSSLRGILPPGTDEDELLDLATAQKLPGETTQQAAARIAGVELPALNDDIVQIKGKQNRAPNDEYLPFVQDFVKSQQWGNIGDFGNTGLVKLPDGRYITQAQYSDIINRAELDKDFTSRFAASGFPRNPSMIPKETWEQYAPHFQGYAVGGKVDADRCFCNNPLSVRRN